MTDPLEVEPKGQIQTSGFSEKGQSSGRENWEFDKSWENYAREIDKSWENYVAQIDKPWGKMIHYAQKH